MRTILLISLLFLIASCGNNNNNNSNTSTTPDYTNACCCNAIFNVGSGKIFVPSMFTPNNDGLNDLFVIRGDTNIKAIFDATFTNTTNSFTQHFDTLYSFNGSIFNTWNGRLVANNTTYEGVFSVSMKVLDDNNVVTNFSGSSCSYINASHASNYVTNYLNCKFSDQLDYINFTFPYITAETKFH